MTSPAIGVAYSLWLRLRWSLSGILLYLLILAAGVQLFPNVAPFVMLGAMALAFAIAHFLNVFTLGPANVGARGSGFPANMFVLPLPTRSLVGWPMLFGMVTHAALWILLAVLVLIPGISGGVEVPLLWPAALLAACTAWVQAISWSPFPSPFARVPALALTLTPLILLGGWAGRYLESDYVSAFVVACCLLWAVAAYAFAVLGLSRARGGSDGDWFRFLAERRAVATRQAFAEGSVLRTPFRSAASAQLWHECRRNALFLPMMVGFTALPMLPMLCMAVLNAENNPGLMFGSTVISPMAMTLGVWILFPELLSGLFAPGMGKFDFWGKEAMPPFFATRPITSSQFVAVKIKAAAISAVVVWGMVLAMFAVWAAVEASSLNPRPSLIRAALAGATPSERVLGLALLIVPATYLWRNIVIGMWITLFGRKWLPTVIGLASLALVSGAAVAGGWIYTHPETRPQFLGFLPWIVAILVTLKLMAAAGTTVALRKSRLLRAGTLRAAIFVWAAVAAGILGAACYFVSPSWWLAAGVTLFLPFSRIAIAPLALDFNRHR